jgi:hypothetical protein
MAADPLPLPGSRAAPLLQAAARVLLLMALVAIPAGAQILKCTDNAGNVVYQNETCPKNSKADRVDIFDNSWTADRAEKDAAWQREATAHRVVAGMPLQWVREALGEPVEVRSTATAGADEVWLYNFPDRSTQVGILANRVLWVRETPLSAPPAAAAAVASEPVPALAPASHAAPDARAAAEGPRALPESHPVPDLPHAATQVQAATQAQAGTQAQAAAEAQAAAQAPRALPESHALPDSSRAVTETSHAIQESPKISESRHGVMRGQDCKQALAELGPPDRQRDVPASDSASGPTTEYFYEPAGSADPTRTRVVCTNGKVEGVDRTVIR